MKNKLTFFRVRARCVCGVTRFHGGRSGGVVCRLVDLHTYRSPGFMREPHSQTLAGPVPGRPSLHYDEYA